MLLWKYITWGKQHKQTVKYHMLQVMEKKEFNYSSHKTETSKGGYFENVHK